jgi:hypothetical protein
MIRSGGITRVVNHAIRQRVRAVSEPEATETAISP